MVSKKSRSLKTADKMASYKERNTSQGSRSCAPRKSPRGKSSKTKSISSTRSSPDGSREIPAGSHRKDPCEAEQNKQKSGDEMPANRLEQALESIPETPPRDGVDFIPETPTRESQVAGRKRALAPRSIDFGRDGSQQGADSQMPSKKRKVFNTPPRGDYENSTASPTRLPGADPEKDSSLLTQPSSRRDHEREGILDMDIFEHDIGSGGRPGNESDQIRRDRGFGVRRGGITGGISNSSFRNDEALDVISISTQALSRLLRSFVKKMVDEMRGLYRHQKSDLRKLTESLVSPIVSEVSDLRSVLELMSNSAKISSSGKACPKTLLTEWEDKLNHLTPKLDIIFSKKVFARIICFNGPLKVCEVYKKCERGVAGKASAAVQSLLWGHQPGATKDGFSEGLGKLHSEFKYAVVQNTFLNVCKDTFDLFRSALAQEEGGNGTVAGARDAQCRINRPGWLKVGYVTVEHINEAGNFMESANQSRKNKIRGTASPDDIATHGALRVYRQLGAHLHKGRANMRNVFFQDLGYLFVPWKAYVKDNDQRKMKLWFATDSSDDGLNIENVPCTDLCSFAAGEEKCNEVDATNRSLLKSMFSEHPETVLHVEHDVHVTSGSGAQRKRTGGEKRHLHRLINLIEVACNVLVEFTRVGTINLFLRGHRFALRCIMVFAYLIKELTVEFVEKRKAMEPDPDRPESTVPDPLHVIVRDTCLKIFLLGKTIQENYLCSRCIRFNEHDYAMLNEEENAEDEFIRTKSVLSSMSQRSQRVTSLESLQFNEISLQYPLMFFVVCVK